MLHQSVSVDQGYKFVRPGPNFLAKKSLLKIAQSYNMINLIFAFLV